MTVRVNQRKTICRGRVFDFTVENVTLAKGVTIDLEVIRHPGASAIVALTEDLQVMMLSQYRHAMKRPERPQIPDALERLMPRLRVGSILHCAVLAIKRQGVLLRYHPP